MSSCGCAARIALRCDRLQRRGQGEVPAHAVEGRRVVVRAAAASAGRHAARHDHDRRHPRDPEQAEEPGIDGDTGLCMPNAAQDLARRLGKAPLRHAAEHQRGAEPGHVPRCRPPARGRHREAGEGAAPPRGPDAPVRWRSVCEEASAHPQAGPPSRRQRGLPAAGPVRSPTATRRRGSRRREPGKFPPRVPAPGSRVRAGRSARRPSQRMPGSPRQPRAAPRYGVRGTRRACAGPGSQQAAVALAPQQVAEVLAGDRKLAERFPEH